ncbi:MAG: MFS transporter [candidate division Zixibacteria bacterium]|nr:MFS transporter [candidate division Zixibacteria bacterium]
MSALSLKYLKQFDRNLWILAGGWFVGALGFAASIPFLAIYFHGTLHLTTTEIGVFFGVMAIVRSLFQAVGGELSDRIGRVGLMIHSQYWRAASFLAMGFAIDFDLGFWPVAALFTVNAIFGAFFMPAVNALVSDILPAQKRLDGYAITRAAGNFGWAAGPAIGGFLAHSSYGTLFFLSAVVTLGSGLIFQFAFKAPPRQVTKESFKFSDLLEVRKDKVLAGHCVLVLMLYLVVAQLVAPFSVYTVEMVGIAEAQLGLLFTINGLMVTLLQLPATRLLGNTRFTTQLAVGSFLYLIGYGILGFFTHYSFFILVIVVITTGEMIMSPPSITLTSRLAPEGRIGRYMGVYGFFVTLGWSFGPLYGGLFLDRFSHRPAVAWMLISSLALLSGAGYLWFGRRLPDTLNRRGDEATSE